MEKEDQIIAYLQRNHECYERFTFDSHMRYLLKNGYDHDESLGLILAHCSLSAITFQERIHNNYYLKISADETISEDLKKEALVRKNKLFNKTFRRSNRLN